MARKKTKKTPEPAPGTGWHVHAVGILFLLVQLAFLPGAASPFRTPKASLVLAGLALIIGFGLIGRFRKGSLSIPRGPLTAVLLALPVLHLLSAAWSPSPRAAFASTSSTAVWVVAVLWIATLESKNRARIVTWCALGASISGGVLVLQAFGFRVIPVADTVYGRMRLTGLAGNPADFAMTAALLLPLLLTRHRDGSRPWFEWALIGVLTAGTAVSLTLTGYVALGLVVLVWLIQRGSWKLWLAAGVVASVALGIALSTGLEVRLSNKWHQLTTGNWYHLLTARSDGWTAAAQMIQSRPAVGVGAANYSYDYYPSRLEWLEKRATTGGRGEQATHFEWAHCDPLQLVAELGLLGVAWLVALGWALVRARPRAPDLVMLSVAAASPFLLLHYPTHLAVGLVPLALIIAHLAADEEPVLLNVQSRSIRWLASAALLAVMVATGWWQMRTVAVDVWRSHLEQLLWVAQQAPDSNQRIQLAAAAELQVARRIDRLPGEAPWLQRVVGRARLLRGDAAGAEKAFRTAYGLWQHEEAEFGLGLALAAQGRRGEALIHLGRVCRVNPSLTRRIADSEIERAVKDLIYTRKGR